MKLPNFLIVGAPKSGTTSFNYYLKEHPQIYMSRVKEPYFFTSQRLQLPESGPGDYKRKYIKEFSQYKELFNNVGDEIAIGEASTDTMFYHSFTINEIHKFVGDVKILIFLRNPVDRAFSAYTHLLRENREPLSFEEGLEKEAERMKQNWNSIWLYTSVGLYFEQVNAFLKSFSQVKVMLYEEVVSDLSSSLIEIYDYLGVNNDFVAPNLETRYNVSGMPKSQMINNFLNMKNPVQRFLKQAGIMLLSDNRYIELREIIRMSNIKKLSISKSTRQRLKDYFQTDILELQKILNKDLSLWLK